MTRTCGDCGYSVPATDKENKINFQFRVCRIHAAQLTTVMTAQGPITQPQWPVLGADKSCGDHMTPEELEAMRRYRLRLWQGDVLPGETKPPLS